jgi:hypothetical protein
MIHPGWLFTESLMAIALGPKQVVSFEELLMSQVVSQKALIKLFVEI